MDRAVSEAPLKWILFVMVGGLLCARASSVVAQPTTLVVRRELAAGVDHNHTTTRQFQHQSFFHKGVWFAFYGDGKDLWYQTSADHGKTWQRASAPVHAAPNGSSSTDILQRGDTVYVCHTLYPLGRYDVHAPYATDPARRHEYRYEGRVKKGLIEHRRIRWLSDVDPGFTPDYSNLVQDSSGHLWVFHREAQQGVAHRSRKPQEIEDWTPSMVCMPQRGRHALDAAALEDGKLYVVSMLTTGGTLYGNLYDGKEWGTEGVLIADDVTTIAGDDRRLSLEFDPGEKRLHLIHVDAKSGLRYRSLDAPYGPGDWRPPLSGPGRLLAEGVFTCAVSVDSTREPYDLMITYGLERHRGRDRRQRLGELHARRFRGGRWLGESTLISEPGTVLNWYPNVNPDARDGLCVIYSRSEDRSRLMQPLRVMVSVCRFEESSAR